MGDDPCADVDVPTYRSRLQWLGKRALSDANLVEEIVWASYSAPERAANGIRLTTDGQPIPWAPKESVSFCFVTVIEF